MQAALKALTEMDCIPEATPADRQRAQAALSSAAPSPPPSSAGAAQPPRSCRRASEPGSAAAMPARRPAQRHARENAAAASVGKAGAAPKQGRRSWTPLVTMDANLGMQPPAGAGHQQKDNSMRLGPLGRKQQPQEGSQGSSEDEGWARAPRLRTPGGGGFDFGVQVYAPPRLPPPPTPAAVEPAVRDRLARRPSH